MSSDSQLSQTGRILWPRSLESLVEREGERVSACTHPSHPHQWRFCDTWSSQTDRGTCFADRSSLTSEHSRGQHFTSVASLPPTSRKRKNITRKPLPTQPPIRSPRHRDGPKAGQSDLRTTTRRIAGGSGQTFRARARDCSSSQAYPATHTAQFDVRDEKITRPRLTPHPRHPHQRHQTSQQPSTAIYQPELTYHPTQTNKPQQWTPPPSARTAPSSGSTTRRAMASSLRRTAQQTSSSTSAPSR